MATEEIRQLLEEIRDAQREHLAEYRRVTQHSLELQERAVERQEQMGRLYRRAIVASAVVIAGIILLIVYWSLDNRMACSAKANTFLVL
jgi:ferric-dicitrate binding protein FerR (iron transport regulator)